MSTQSPHDGTSNSTPGRSEAPSSGYTSTEPAPVSPTSATPSKSDQLSSTLATIAILYGIGALIFEVSLIGFSGTDFGVLETMLGALPIVLLVGIVYAIVIGMRGGVARTCGIVCGCMMIAPILWMLGFVFLPVFS